MHNREKNDPTFGPRLKQILKIRGLSQKKVSEILGISPSAMTNYINGRIPEPRILHQIAQLCNVSMEWLLTGKERTYADINKTTEMAAESTPIYKEATDIVKKIESLPPEKQKAIYQLIDSLLKLLK